MLTPFPLLVIILLPLFFQGPSFKNSLSSSLPELPVLNSRPLAPLKYEKLSFRKAIHHELPPPPAVTLHPRQAALPPIKATPNEQDAFNIMNMLDRTVEYYEEKGHVYITDDRCSRQWKEGCDCKQCRKKKTEWIHSRQKDEDIKLKKIRNGIKMRDTESSPVKEEIMSDTEDMERHATSH